MVNVRVLVADDEPLARRGVRQLLAVHADMKVVGESRNGLETLRALDELNPDLLFLDVQMPEMDGLAVVRARSVGRMPEVVFVTAHDRFAVQAFEAQAIDYLVKPLNVERFETTLGRVRERFRLLRAAQNAAKLTALLASEHDQPERHGIERFVITAGASNLIISTKEVDWIGADDYYACLHVGGKRYLLRESLTSLEKQLDGLRFARVHRAAIVQLDRVREIRTTENGDEAFLRDGVRIPISRRKRAALDRLLRRRIIR